MRPPQQFSSDLSQPGLVETASCHSEPSPAGILQGPTQVTHPSDHRTMTLICPITITGLEKVPEERLQTCFQ